LDDAKWAWFVDQIDQSCVAHPDIENITAVSSRSHHRRPSMAPSFEG
jgi:hypothetical protein